MFNHIRNNANVLKVLQNTGAEAGQECIEIEIDTQEIFVTRKPKFHSLGNDSS